MIWMDGELRGCLARRMIVAFKPWFEHLCNLFGSISPQIDYIIVPNHGLKVQLCPK